MNQESVGLRCPMGRDTFWDGSHNYLLACADLYSGPYSRGGSSDVAAGYQYCGSLMMMVMMMMSAGHRHHHS